MGQTDTLPDLSLRGHYVFALHAQLGVKSAAS